MVQLESSQWIMRHGRMSGTGPSGTGKSSVMRMRVKSACILAVSSGRLRLFSRTRSSISFSTGPVFLMKRKYSDGSVVGRMMNAYMTCALASANSSESPYFQSLPQKCQ